MRCDRIQALNALVFIPCDDTACDFLSRRLLVVRVVHVEVLVSCGFPVLIGESPAHVLSVVFAGRHVAVIVVVDVEALALSGSSIFAGEAPSQVAGRILRGLQVCLALRFSVVGVVDVEVLAACSCAILVRECAAQVAGSVVLVEVIDGIRRDRRLFYLGFVFK